MTASLFLSAGVSNRVSKGLRTLLLILVSIVVFGSSAQASIGHDFVYAVHDGTELKATFYRSDKKGAAPVIIAVHGGGWQRGDRTLYRHWGPYVSTRGYAMMAIEYRIGPKTYPQAIGDVRAAVQYVRAHASELGIDRDRIILMGDSAGAHLAAMVALTAHEARFQSLYADDPNSKESVEISSAILVYGIYDMAAQWQHDQIKRPRDHIVEKFLGTSLAGDRKLYFEASPMSYAQVGQSRTLFILAYGLQDDIVDPISQSNAFLLALSQAGLRAQQIPLSGASHLWMWEPLDDPNSHTRKLASHLFPMLQEFGMGPK